MKKIIFVLTLVAGIFAMYSCSNQDGSTLSDTSSPTIQTQEKELAELRTMILVYNSEMPSSNVTKGKKWWKWLRWLFCGVADAAGAAVGGVYGAVGTSALAGALVGSSDIGNVNGQSLAPRRAGLAGAQNGIVIDKTQYQAEFSDSIGYYHNVALAQLLADTETYNKFCTTEGVEQMSFVDNAVETICGKSAVAGLSSSDKYAIYNKGKVISQIAASSESLEDFIKGLKAESGNLGLTIAEIDVLSAYFEGLSEVVLSDENGVYMKDILKYTDQSNLSEDMKVKLGNVMIVANASMKLWGNGVFAIDE